MLVSALMILALGLALGRWYWGYTHRGDYLKPGFLSSWLGSAFVLFLAGLCVVWGLGLTALVIPPGLLLVLILGLALFAYGLKSKGRHGQLRRDLTKEYQEARQEYPDLDREALFMFMLRDHFPTWHGDKILEIVEDCDSVDELVRRVSKADKEQKNAR